MENIEIIRFKIMSGLEAKIATDVFLGGGAPQPESVSHFSLRFVFISHSARKYFTLSRMSHVQLVRTRMGEIDLCTYFESRHFFNLIQYFACFKLLVFVVVGFVLVFVFGFYKIGHC